MILSLIKKSFLFFGGCTLLWHLAYWPQDVKNKATKLPKVVIEEYMHNAQAFKFNEQGKIKQKFSISQWARNLGESTTKLTEPFLQVSLENGNNWEIRANNGIIHSSSFGNKLTKIELKENVKIINNTAANKKHPLVLTTKTMILDPTTSLAQTEDEVQLIQNKFSLKAKGMRANIKDEEVHFLSKVETSYL